MSFDYQIDEFMVYCRSKQLREKTMSSYEQALRLFQRWCESEMNITKVDQVSESVMRRYINDLQERGKYSFYSDDEKKKTNYPERRRDFRKPISVITINSYIRELRVFFNWLDEDYKMKRNPMQKIRLLKVNRKARDFINDEDFKKLVSQLDKSYYPEHRDFAMIMLMIDTGMRLGECTTVLMTDLHLASHKICLRAETTKGRKDRVVFFSPKTETVLRRWIRFKDRYVESDYLFPIKAHGGHVNVSNFETNFKKYLRRAGLNDTLTPHCLRNNFAKRCLTNGMDIYTLSKILGHSSVKITEEAYLDLTDDDLGKRYQHYSPVRNM